MRRAAIAAALLLWASAASAQDYPTRPIRIIVPTPAGGPVDVMARVLANALPPVLGTLIMATNHEARELMFGERLGIQMMIGAAVLQGVGTLIIRKIINIPY